MATLPRSLVTPLPSSALQLKFSRSATGYLFVRKQVNLEQFGISLYITKCGNSGAL